MAKISNKLIEKVYTAPDLPDRDITRTQLIETGAVGTFTGTSFSGTGVFEFKVPQNWFFIPSRSYLNITTSILFNSAQPTLTTDLAPAMNHAHNLFSGMALDWEQQTISEIKRDYPQIAIYSIRTKIPATVLNTMNYPQFLDPSFYTRNALIASDAPATNTGFASSRITEECKNTTADSLTTVSGATVFPASLLGKQYMYKGSVGVMTAVAGDSKSATITGIATAANTNPTTLTTYAPLSATSPRSHINEIAIAPALDLFMDSSIVLPAGTYRLSVTTQNQSQLGNYALESYTAQTFTTTTVAFTVSDIKFNACMCQYNSGSKGLPRDYQYIKNVVELKVQSLSSVSSTVGINITPGTSKMGLALQSTTVAANTTTPNSISKFKVGPLGTEEIQEVSIDYSGQIKPAKSHIIAYSAGSNKYLSSYRESTLTNDLGVLGGEPFSDWIDRGPIFTFGFKKGRDASTTTASVKVTSTAGLSNLLLFCEYQELLNIDVSSKKVTRIVSV